ncbi:hypothetical protein FA041_11175 [Escherichia coli]|nr:hypothetical protein [Escherichia coli]
MLPKALSPAAIPAGKEYANKSWRLTSSRRNLSLTVDADPQAEISSKETLAENLTSLTLSNGAGLFWQNPRVKSKSYKLLPYRIKAI